MTASFIALGVFCAVYFPLGFLMDFAARHLAQQRRRKESAPLSFQRKRRAA